MSSAFSIAFDLVGGVTQAAVDAAHDARERRKRARELEARRAEQHRIAMEAVHARLERLTEHSERLAARRLRGLADHPELQLPVVPTTAGITGSDPEELERNADRLDQELHGVSVTIERMVVAARIETTQHAVATMTAQLRAGLTPLRDQHPETHRKARKDTASEPASEAVVDVGIDPERVEADATRIFGRLPEEVDDDTLARCRSIIDQLAAVRSTARADVLLTALRTTVIDARARHAEAVQRRELIARNEIELERFHRLLDGFEGEEVAGMRGYLRGLPPDAPLPSGLEAAVARVRTAAEAKRRRAIALDILRTTLIERGYELGEDFTTAVASDAGVILPVSASQRHGTRVRARDDRLLFNVVRFERAEGDQTDVDAATAVCDELDEVVADLQAHGVRNRVLERYPADSGVIESVDTVSPFDATPKHRDGRARRDRPRELERER